MTRQIFYICDLAPQNGWKVASFRKADFDTILFLVIVALKLYQT